jgi:hypothetical protein
MTAERHAHERGKHQPLHARKCTVSAVSAPWDLLYRSTQIQLQSAATKNRHIAAHRGPALLLKQPTICHKDTQQHKPQHHESLLIHTTVTGAAICISACY